MSDKYQRMAIDTVVATFPANAPIRAIRAAPAVEAKMQAFEVADARAIAAQASYRFWARLALAASTTGAIIGALLLLPTWLVAKLPPGLVGGAQIAALALAAVLMWTVTATKRVPTWTKARGEAEQHRGDLFRMIIDAPVPAGADPDKTTTEKHHLIQTAFFDDQLKYFRKRVATYKTTSSQLSPLRLAGYGLFAVVGLMALPLIARGLAAIGVIWPNVFVALTDWLVTHDADRWRLAAATIASSMLTHASARSAMDQDARNAALYAVTADRVEALIATRPADVDINPVALRGHFQDVQRVLEAEHIAWFVSPPEVLARAPKRIGVKV